MPKTKKKKEERAARLLSNNLYMIGLLFKNAPFLILGNFFFQIATSYPWTLAEILLVPYIIRIVQSDGNISHVFVVLLVLTVVLVAAEFGQNLFNRLYAEKKTEELFLKLQSALYKKAAAMDLEAYDDPTYYNDFVLAMESAEERATETVESLAEFMSELVAIGSVAAVLASIDIWCFVMIVLSGVLAVPVGRKIASLRLKLKEDSTPFDRKTKYFLRVFYLPAYAKELRLNPVGSLLEKRYVENTHETERVINRYQTKIWKLWLCQESLPFSVICCGVVVCFMGYKALVTKTADLSEFIATFNGAEMIGGTVMWLSIWISRNLRENGLFIEKYRKFLSYETKIKDGSRTDSAEEAGLIEFKNVSFTYPGNEEPSLRNINLKIEPRKKIALVGYNGAGKTTLTNLLLRLYDVSEGAILVNGTDIREQTLESHKARFSAVFQDFGIFAASVAENVAMDAQPQPARVEEALRECGFDTVLPDGVSSQLQREFDDDGLQLSGGEEQKVAIARAFYRQCPYVILDEPSANLDPMAEYKLNAAIAHAAADRTVLFISHRLSTTRMADTIYMMENGEIIETGTHEELMELDGKYAYMFRLQAEKYQ